MSSSGRTVSPGETCGCAAQADVLDAAKLLGVLIAFFVLAGLAGWARARSPAAGLVVTILVIVGFTGLWLWTSTRLPHRDAGWMDLVPGAIAVGVGVGILQMLAAYLLAPYALRSRERTVRSASPRRCS